MQKFALMLLLVSLCGIMCACVTEGDRPDDAVRTDSSGVTIVLNEAPDRMLSWAYREVRRLGGHDDGPESFYAVSRRLVTVDREGNLAVLNRSESRFIVFSPEGQFKYAAGREGEGPGEFENPVEVRAIPSGGFAVLDLGRDRYIQFDTSGTLLTEVEVRGGRLGFFILEDGVLFQRQEYHEDGYVQDLVWSTQSDTTVVASTALARISRYRLEGCGWAPGMVAPVIFAPELVWNGQRESVAFNSEPVYAVNFLDQGRQISRSVRRSWPVRRATHEDAVTWAEQNPTRMTSSAGECVFPATMVAEKRGHAEFVPVIHAIVVAPDGSLWVQRSSGPEANPRIDVFAQSGQYLGTLADTLAMPITFMPTGEAVLAERDELDIERIVIAEVLHGERETGS